MFAVLVLTLLAVGVDAAQKSNSSEDHDPQPPVFRVEVNLVSVPVLVTDRKKHAVDGLKGSDFSIYEDGKLQKISSFAAVEQPISLVILLDKSNSMGDSGKMDEARGAALSLVDACLPSDELLLLTFHHDVFKTVDFTHDHERIKSAISKTDSERGGSSPHDAILEGLELLGNAGYPRQALVLITDGADQHSTHNLDEVVQAVQESQAQVFLIGYFSPKEDETFRESGKRLALISGQEIDNPRYVFKRLAEESGAECFYPKSEADLKKAIETISGDLWRQYSLAYYSSNMTGSKDYRTIQVKVNRSGLKVRARIGYRLSSKNENGIPIQTTRKLEQLSAPKAPLQSRPFESKVEHKDGRLIYKEDFSDSNSGWPNKDGFFYDRGEYHVTKPGNAAANGPWLRDIRATLSVVLRTGSSQKNEKGEIVSIGNRFPGTSPIEVKESLPGAGLVFRLNEKGFYAFLISGFVGSSGVFFKLVRKDVKSNQVSDILPWTPERVQQRPNSLRRRLSVTCQGDSIQLTIDDRLEANVHDQGIEDGMAGMILFGEGHAVFDDLVVEEISESN